MQNVLCLLTSLVFAVHALLGCAAHRSCGHRAAILPRDHEECGVHACVTHHEGHDSQPADDEHDSPAPCSHSVCSYVKAETQQVDLRNAIVAFWAVLRPIDLGPSGAVTAAVSEPICQADISSTQLFVWHCALII
jgi:hypothetical protein